MTIIDVELIIAGAPSALVTVSLRVELPSRRVDLAEGVSMLLDEALLLAHGNNPEQYGAALSGQLFVPELREAWQRAHGFAEGEKGSLRVRLVLHGNDELHAIRWELLRDPLTGVPLAHSERIRLSRFLSSSSLGALQTSSYPDLKAVVAVANPAQLATYHLMPVDVAGERGRAEYGLGNIPTTILDGQAGRPAATVAAIATALRRGAHILYLVCHGKLIDGEAYLYLEQEAGVPYRPTDGEALVHLIRNLEHRPLLVVLATCHGAGDTHTVLAAIGPRLAQTGVGAVVAMQGNVPMDVIVAFMPRFFAELRRDGQIDRAIAAARGALPTDAPWWMPTLWMAVRDGRLWQTPEDQPARKTIVFQMPYLRNPLFRGRETELATLAHSFVADAANKSPVVIAIVGTGGMGKSQLATEFSYRYKEAFPGGIFWLPMEQPTTVASEVARTGGPEGLDLPNWAQLNVAHQVAAVRKAWEEPVRRLLIFDNLEDPKLLQEWLPRGGGSQVLITSRRGVWSATSGVILLRLKPLKRDESVELLLAPRAIARKQEVKDLLQDERVEADASAIAGEVGDLPLALALAGLYLEANPSLTLTRYREQLHTHAHSHRSLNTQLEESLPTGHGESITATIALSYERLGQADEHDVIALALLQRAAQLAPEPIPHRLLVRLAERDPADEEQLIEVDAALRRLVGLGLLDLGDQGATIHRLVAAFVRAQFEIPWPVQAVIVKALQAELDVDDWQRSPTAPRVYLSHALAFCNRWGETLPGPGWNLLNTCGQLFYAAGNRAAARTCHEYALGLARRLAGSDHPAFRVSLNNLGLLLHRLGHLSEARPYLQEALELAEKHLGQEHFSTATALNNLGGLILELGEFEQAHSYLERAQIIFEREWGPADPRTAENLGYLGGLFWHQRNYAAARPYLERALVIKEQALGSTHPTTANYRSTLGHLLRLMGRLEEARSMIEQALAIQKEVLGLEHPDTIESTARLGDVYKEEGDLTQARLLYEQALEGHKQVFDSIHPELAWAHDRLGELLLKQGNLEDARLHYEQALAIWTQLFGTEHTRSAYGMNKLGEALLLQGHTQEARSYMEQALAIQERIFGNAHESTQETQKKLASLDEQS